MSADEPTLTAASVAPEDLKCGSFVAISSQVVEVPSFLWGNSWARPQDSMVRLQCTPRSGGIPLKVEAICLPYVLARTPFDRPLTLDVRQVQLLQLESHYAKKAWKALRKHRPVRGKSGGR